ncbi:MAG: hypothetical protein ABI844_11945 [Saprospiraceae bacterium]
MLIEETVTAWLGEKFTEESFKECFIIEVKYHAHRLEIYLDSDGRLDLDMCSQISRWLAHKIEEANMIDEHYTIEVSSSGLDRPLKLMRQYFKNIGRAVDIHMKDGRKLEGILTEVKPDMIIIKQEIIEKEGKKKVKKSLDTIILLEDIQKTFIQIKF